MATKETQTGLTGFTRSVLREAVVDVVGGALAAAAIAVLLLVGLLIWEGGSVPAWLAALLLAASLVWAVIAHARMVKLGGRVQELEPQLEMVPELESDLERYDGALDRHDVYSSHIAKMLDQLQRVVARELDVPIPQFIERGILQPARDLFIEDSGGDVRISVLLPREEPDRDRWEMVLSAGHSVIGERKYDARISDTLARLPYEEGIAWDWDDVTTDHRFVANPHSTREIHAMVSLPLRQGDETFGVLNAISSLPGVFDVVEHRYLGSLASVVSVALGVFLKDQERDADD